MNFFMNFDSKNAVSLQLTVIKKFDVSSYLSMPYIRPWIYIQMQRSPFSPNAPFVPVNAE
jgi:hypothetical protein